MGTVLPLLPGLLYLQPLKGWWLKTVSLAEPGQKFAPGSPGAGRPDRPPPLLAASSPARHPTGQFASSGLYFPSLVLCLSDVNVCCSLNRVWRKN